MILVFCKVECSEGIRHRQVADRWVNTAANCLWSVPDFAFSSCSETAFTKLTVRDRSYSVDYQLDKVVHSRIINNLLKSIVPTILDTTDKWQESGVCVCVCVSESVFVCLTVSGG